jgi:UDPglucose--hexose-1-phosphate uridylyltransferase
MILPRSACRHFHAADADAVTALAALTQRIIARLNRVAPRADYNWWLHQAPFTAVGTSAPGIEQWHWHLEILPRLSAFAGFELATGCHITTMSPAESARRLREA